jgi:RNA polymerase sigma-70 factor, ECF subfamily
MRAMGATDQLARAFRAALAVDAPVLDEAAVGRILAAAMADASGQWPGVDIEPETFAAYVAERLPEAQPAEQSLASMALADLYLACAAAGSEPRALEALDQLIARAVAMAGDAARAPAAARDEVAQVVRTLLLVPRPARPPALLDYTGRGPLGGWLRIIASREVVRLVKRGGREVELDDAVLADQALGADDPVLRGLKERYREELADAFRAALAALGPKERTLLRYQLMDGLSIDDIGVILRVHRATAARRLARVRDALVTDTRSRLAEKLRIADDEVQSIIRLVQSELDVSIIKHLRTGVRPR